MANMITSNLENPNAVAVAETGRITALSHTVDDPQAKADPKQITWQLPSPAAFGSQTAIPDPSRAITQDAILTDTIPPSSRTPLPLGSSANTCHQDEDCTTDDWQAMLYAATSLPAKAQLDMVNSWANKIRYVEDRSNWAMADYWQTTEEFIARGGDCEDYAITKYFGLKQLGFAAEDMRIVVLFDQQLRLHHAVLLVELDGEVWMLDNQMSSVTAFSEATHYRPIYSLNENNWWMHKTLKPVRLTVAKPVRLSATRTNTMRRFR